MNAQLLIVIACSVAASGFGGGAEEPAEASSTKTKISEEQIPTLPATVHYSASRDGKHVYIINGIGAAPIPVGGRQEPLAALYQTPLDYIPSLPERVSFSVNHDTRTCTLVTSRELSRTELSAAIDETAKARSDIPCWAELEARDLQRSAEFRDDRYVPEKVDGKAPSGLAWFWLLGSQGFTTPFVVKFGGPLGSLHIVPTVVPRRSQSHYTIRVLDHDGRILWSDTSTVFGPGRIAVADSDGDDCHELYVESYNEGASKLFHIKPTSEQAVSGNGGQAR